jgi:hypothetical protein
MGVACGIYTSDNKAHEILVGGLERKRPLGRPMCRKDKNNMNLKGTRMKAWIGYIWLRTGISGGFM